MRDFKIITGYELKQQLGKKSVRVTTIILMLAALIATSFPRISQMVKGDVPAGGTAQEAAQTAGQDDYMSLETGYVFADEAQRAEYSAMLNLKAANVYPSRDALVSALKEKTLKVGFVMAEDGFESIYQDKGMEGGQAQRLSALMSARHTDHLLAAKGLTAQDLAEIQSFSPRVTETVMGRSIENNILVSMILMIAIYMIVLLYGSTTSVMIAREKDSKAMELLITSTKPAPLILGKVAAAGISGVLQFGLIVLAALGGFMFAKESYDPSLIAMLQGSLSRSYIFTYIFFSFTGYLLYDFHRLGQLNDLAAANSWNIALRTSISLYLDVINLFLDLLDFLSR